MVIFLLSPFNISELSLLGRLIQALLNAIIAVVCIGITVVGMRRLFPLWSKFENWTIGKDIMLFLWVITMIATVHFGLYFSSSKRDSVALFQQVVLRILAISIFRIIGLVFLNNIIIGLSN